MLSLFDLLNSRLPVITIFEEKFKEKYNIETFTGHWNETYYVYLFVMSLVHISLLMYTFYLLYTCLRVKKTQGAGTTFVNGFCDVIFACFCMPCYIVYRGFLNPCKVLAEEKIITKYVGLPVSPNYGQQVPAPAPASAPAPVYQQPVSAPATNPVTSTTIMAQQPGANQPLLVPASPTITSSAKTRVISGGQKKTGKRKIKKGKGKGENNQNLSKLVKI
tara:strand:- start:63 stop:719 length:657 start_codon:yes stop_codon:yes gene_type:complete